LRFRCGALGFGAQPHPIVERALPAGRELEFIAPSPGGLLQVFEGDAVLFELGVNFLDESETNLRDRKTEDVGRFTDVAALRAESGQESDPLFWLLLAISGTAILINWCLLGQRRHRMYEEMAQTAHVRGRDERSGAMGPRERGAGVWGGAPFN
jgi:hypothetical protein